jgi:hypothetical protein
MYELKKIGKVFTSKFVGTGPSSYKKKLPGRGLTKVEKHWSRGSALPLSTQVRGFKPGQRCQDFQGRKIFSAPSFGGEVKPSVPYRRFTACKKNP